MTSPAPGEPGALRRFVLPILFMAGLLALLYERRPEPDAAPSTFVQLRGATMGTSYTVKVVGELDEAGQRALADAVERALGGVDGAMSTYKPESELSRLNRLPADTPFHASPELRLVLEEARRVHALSGGAFDVTVGPLVNRWGFGPGKKHDAPPDDGELAALRARVGDALLRWEGDTLLKARADVYVDLSAIAKGYGVDKVAEAIEAGGHERYLVEVGGEVRVRGTNPDGKPWQVGVEKPVGGADQPVQEVVPLGTGSLATSGDYRNYYERDGKRISHTIDARTGRPIEHRLASVTVIHPSCTTADALATALNVLGPEAGLELATREKLAALFIVRTEAGEFELRRTPEFDALR